MADRELLKQSLSAILDLLGDVEPCDCKDTDSYCPVVNARKTRDDLLERLAQPERGGRTGWPAGMLQDDSPQLSKWLASKPDARRHAREAAEAVRLARAVRAHPRCGYPHCACVGQCFVASQPGSYGALESAPIVPVYTTGTSSA